MQKRSIIIFRKALYYSIKNEPVLTIAQAEKGWRADLLYQVKKYDLQYSKRGL